MTLMKELLDEMIRNQDLLREYQAIGTPGMIGASMIRIDVEQAKKSIEENNLPEMFKIFEKLKNNK